MNFYLVKMVFRITVGGAVHAPQFDEQLRLLFADDEAEALEKAEYIAKKEEDLFLNRLGEPVQWIFTDITDIRHIHQPMDGAEIYSRIEEPENEAAYLLLIQNKAAQLRQRNFIFEKQ